MTLKRKRGSFSVDSLWKKWPYSGLWFSWEQIDWTLPNFVYMYALVLTRLELLRASFLSFVTESWPLIIVRILFPLNILITNERDSTNFCEHRGHDFSQIFAAQLWPRIDVYWDLYASLKRGYCKILWFFFFQKNNILTYLEKILPDTKAAIKIPNFPIFSKILYTS